jgi:DNA mismatch repair protein MutS
MNTIPLQARVSLLWPSGSPDPGLHGDCASSTVADLDLESLIDALAIHARYRNTVRDVLLGLCRDERVIGYRQDILSDLLALPELVATFEEILPKLVEVGYLGGARRQTDTPLHHTIWRLGELELYGECVTALEHGLGAAEGSLHSRGLLSLLAALRQISADESFQTLMERLPEMRALLKSLRSVTIGVNLDHLLRPVEATLLSVGSETFSGSTFLSKLFGKPKPMEGVGPLHQIDTASLPDVRERPFMQPLFRDLDRVIRSAVRPIADVLTRYARVSSQFLLALEHEIAFYVGATRFVGRLRGQGLPLCRPEYAPAEERVSVVEDTFNVNLALRMRDARAMVLNDVHFDEEGRVLILTGPNRGGKTTFTQAVGLVHVLHQAGLLVPGKRARLSPVDAIWTHFPMAEEFSLDAGRLGEEARRLEAIFRCATPHSLILLNESLFSTSPGESLYLARDVVRASRYLGARAIYATHLHELAANVEEINRETPGTGRVASLIATVDRVSSKGDATQADGETDAVNPTFHIEPGPPLGLSYARQIAARYGISFEQLVATIDEHMGNPPDNRVGRLP